MRRYAGGVRPHRWSGSSSNEKGRERPVAEYVRLTITSDDGLILTLSATPPYFHVITICGVYHDVCLASVTPKSGPETSPPNMSKCSNGYGSEIHANIPKKVKVRKNSNLYPVSPRI
jgi:hypothetical protein